jgi:hypothetical protein
VSSRQHETGTCARHLDNRQPRRGHGARARAGPRAGTALTSTCQCGRWHSASAQWPLGATASPGSSPGASSGPSHWAGRPGLGRGHLGPPGALSVPRAFFFGKHIYRLRTPLTANDPELVHRPRAGPKSLRLRQSLRVSAPALRARACSMPVATARARRFFRPASACKP